MRNEPILPIPAQLRLITAVVLLSVAVLLFVSQQAIVLNQKTVAQVVVLKTAVAQRLARLKAMRPVLSLPRCQKSAC